MAITYSPFDKLCMRCNCIVKIKYADGNPVGIVTVLRDDEENETYEPHRCYQEYIGAGTTEAKELW